MKFRKVINIFEKIHFWHPMEKNVSIKCCKKVIVASIWGTIYTKIGPTNCLNLFPSTDPTTSHNV